MTINQIIIEALHDPANWKNGEVNWSFIDADLWCHNDAGNFTDQELFDGLNNFPNELIPECPTPPTELDQLEMEAELSVGI